MQKLFWDRSHCLRSMLYIRKKHGNYQRNNKEILACKQ